jgi:beta-mannosidase
LGGLFPKNRHFFAAVKDLQRTPVQLETTLTPVSDHEIHVDLQAPEYAFFVHLYAPDERTTFSDNYFDLEPGESRTVVVANEGENLEPKSVEVRWR